MSDSIIYQEINALNTPLSKSLYYSLSFSKPLTNDIEKMDNQLLHIVAGGSPDRSPEALKLLKFVLESSRTLESFQELINGMSKARRTPIMVAC